MSYQPPYAGQGQYYNDPRYNAEYNPYDNRPPPNNYDPGEYQPYSDEPSLPPAHSQEALAAPMPKEESTFDHDFTAGPGGSRAQKIRAYRYQHQGGNLWVRGSRPLCCCRFCFCFIFIVLFLLLGIVMSLALWIQPPNVIIGGNGSSVPVVSQGVNILGNGIQVNLGLPISVQNPNYFSAKLTNVWADIIYPINNTLIGNGTLKDVELPAHANTNFTFPFSIDYTESIDPNFSIISDIAEKCLGNPQKDLSINYKITVGVSAFMVHISPTISNSISFPCPISASDIQDVLKNIGADLQNILGGAS